uniref:Uncharacterized protein n=1 Tax=Corvus moneduloides TaxID=1196302 RepID=A0A8C3DN30_CORMO
MRVLAVTLAVLLLVAICYLAEADLRISRRAATSQMQGRFLFPGRDMIRSAYMTSNSCPKPCRHPDALADAWTELCANPEARWVQEYLKHLEQPEN